MSAGEKDHADELDALLRTVPTEENPPPGLREQVVDRLVSDGLVRTGHKSVAARLRWTLAAAALIAAFFAGRETAPVPGGSPADPASYALLLFDDEGYDPGQLAPEEVVALYAEWAARERDDGTLVLAEKLADEETLLAGNVTSRRRAGTGTTPGNLSGIFLIRAASREEAVRIAQDLPHRRLGGAVLVRAIDPT